jgi:hypothetical protein
MSAVISQCELFRYALTRETGLDGVSEVVFIMLNPSTADATKDDPTIRKCRHFAKELGAHVFHVVNLFGFRATNPKELPDARDPIGPENDAYIREYLQRENVEMVIAAWGTNHFGGRANGVIDLVTKDLKKPLYSLRVTKHGHPGHPLYLPNVTKPEIWKEAS